ncbi:MAG: sodium:solute symporter family transporter [Limisphaerales bacterium]
MNEAGTTNTALISFGVYLLGVFFLAWLSSRVREKKEFVGEYFLGSRNLGLWAFALTFAATSASGGSFMGFPSLIYTHGWVLALWIASYMVVPIVGMGLLGKRMNRLARQSGAVTIPDIIKARFKSDAVGMIATLLILFFMFFYLLAQFKAGSKIMTTLLQDVPVYQNTVAAVGNTIDGLPWVGGAEPDYVLCLLVFSFSVIVYTAFGGFRAVVWTDVMQGVVMGAGVIILLILTLGQVGGLSKATEQLKEMTPPENGTGFITLGQSADEDTTLPKGTWLRLTDGGIARLAEQVRLAKGKTETEAKLLRITTPAEVERIEPTQLGFAVSTSFTPTEANGYGAGRKGVYVSAPGPHPDNEDGFLNVWVAVSFFFFWAFGSAGQPSNMVRLMAFNGTNVLRKAMLSISIYFTVIYLLLVVIFCCGRILLPGMEIDSDRIMPELAATVTSSAGVPWLAGLLLAAPFAAVMSSVDSFLLMVSSSVVRDIYQNRVNPDASEQRLKKLSYLVTAVVGILAMLAVLNPPEYLQDLIVFATSGLAGCFLMPVLLGLYWPGMTARGAIAGMLGGLGCHLGLYLIGWFVNGKFASYQLLEFNPFIWAILVSGLLSYLASLKRATEKVEN